MTSLQRSGSALALLLALGACVQEPVGGPGPFDPPRPARVDSPLFASPGVTDFRPFPDVAQPPLPEAEPLTEADEIAADVTATLRATPGSTVPTGGPVVGVAPTAGAAGQADPFQQDIGIDPNAQSINLALSSQEEQKRQREIAEQRRLAAQQELVIIQPEAVARVDPNANIIAFARQTTHPVGTKLYNRPAFRDRLQSASTCRRFSSVDEAQRQFLANGGPNNDRFNLDPDGDGFACRFDPTPYRQMSF